ncbi:MAG TPA: menaquinone biosynthesis protein, partial [Chitinophagaceae bacterium]|nr:menaquinone biosynthesis protein [Chitinophagaceae bacterium]
ELRVPLPSNLLHLDKIKVAAVSYLNTKPLLYGIKRHGVLKKMDLIEDYPAKIAQLLIENKVDVGLVPVAIIPKLKDWHIITDYCIGADGAVASVCIFSEVPIWEVEKVYLDYQSRTSVRLAQILLKEYWKKDVTYIDATGEDFRKKISGTTAGVIIGDRALQQRAVSKYSYDLGEAWKEHTGLPFVFAAWISNKKLPSDFISAFNEANTFGLNHLTEVVAENVYPYFSLHDYFTKCISYVLDDAKKEGLALFLEKLEVKQRV